MSGDKKPTSPSAECGNSPTSNTIATCPINCPTDFLLKVPCKIIKVDGGNLHMTVSDLPGFSGGTYIWTTTSSKITLVNSNSSTVTVNALANPSVSRDAETVTVTRTAVGCSPIVKTVNITVAKVTFSKSENQRYGYDNFDTPTNYLDDHICVKQSDYTFLKVVIEGGAVGTDFNFMCDDSSICTPVLPGDSASFDLRLNAKNKLKANTTLHAKCRCPDATSFAKVEVHVYKEREVDVVVAKIDNPTTTYLRFPTANYAAHSVTANNKLKEAVVKYNITNYKNDNTVTPIAFVSGNGVLSYDIANGGGADLTAIQTAMTGTGTKVRVVIIRDMKSYYYLSAATAIGGTTITVRGASTFYAAGDTAPLGAGASRETVTIVSLAGNTITCNALTKAHSIGETLEFPAAGWSSDPILIIEGSASLDIAKWTVLHEVGHRDKGLTLRDIIDNTDFMHFQQSWTDYRLRYCPRTKKYPAGTADTENQWETIPRN